MAQKKDGTERKKRNTQAEQLAALDRKREILQSKMAGTYEPDQDTNVEKALERRLSKTNTVLRSTRNMLDGTEIKGKWISSIYEKIEKTKARLESQEKSALRAEELAVKLPFDIEKLSALVEVAKIGDVVDFPDDLTPLPAKGNTHTDGIKKTDDEIEAEFIANQETESTEA